MAISPNDRLAYVTNGISGTVSVVNLGTAQGRRDDQGRHRAAGLRADAERQLALCRQPHRRHRVHHRHGLADGGRERRSSGRNPTAIAITNNGDEADTDETVFVTQIFAELDPDFVDPFGVGGEVRDLGKQGWSTPSRRATPIRQSPRSPCLRSPIPASPPAARTSARARTPPTWRPRSSARTRPACDRPGQREQPAGDVPEPAPVGVDSRQPSVSAEHRRPARAAGAIRRERAGARQRRRHRCTD